MNIKGIDSPRQIDTANREMDIVRDRPGADTSLV